MQLLECGRATSSFWHPRTRSLHKSTLTPPAQQHSTAPQHA